MELSTLDKIENKHSGEVEKERKLGKTGDSAERYRYGIKTITKLLENFSPKVVLVPVDLGMLRELERERQTTAFCNDDKLFQTIRSGSMAYLTKDVTADETRAIVDDAEEEECPVNESHQGRTEIARQALGQLHNLSMMDRETEGLDAQLTRREAQTLRYMAEGYSNKQIARALYVSEQTVKNHVSSVQHKLGANNRTHAVVLALRLGCIDIAGPV